MGEKNLWSLYFLNSEDIFLKRFAASLNQSDSFKKAVQMGSDSVKVEEKQASHYSIQKVLNKLWVCLETYIGSDTPFATSAFFMSVSI